MKDPDVYVVVWGWKASHVGLHGLNQQLRYALTVLGGPAKSNFCNPL